MMIFRQITSRFNDSFIWFPMKRVFLTRFLCQRPLSSSRINDLYTQMKQLNSTKQFRQSIALFDHHRENHMKITNGAICQALDACIATNDIQRGKRIHQELSSQSQADSFIQIYLIRLYMKCGDVRQAKSIFLSSKKKTTGMLDALLIGLLMNNGSQEALDLFQRLSIPPSSFTYATLFKICSKIGNDQSYQYGKMLLEKMPHIHRQNPIVLTSALKMLMENGDIATGEKIFCQIKKDLHAYGTMMSGYLANNRPQQAIDLFFRINKPDQINYFIFFNACAELASKESLALGKKVFTEMPKEYLQLNGKTRVHYALLNMFARCDDKENAEAIFHRSKRDVMSYGTMMKMYNQKETPEKVLSLYEQMQIEHIQPDQVIYLMMINAYAQLGDLSLCESIISRIPSAMVKNLQTQNSLIDMWGKSGSVDRAKDVFDKIVRPDIVSYSAMINTYGLNGMGNQAVELFYHIPKHLLDEWIFVCVLNACSHSGLVNHALKIFETIPRQNRTEQIYTVMVDALSRSYLFDEAQKLIVEFEKNHHPVYLMYMAMLSGARSDRNVNLANRIFDQIEDRFPQNKDCITAATVLLANTHALSGDISTASSIRMKLSQTGMKRKSGISSTVYNGHMVQFRAHDRSHPQSLEIYAEIDRLNHELIKYGYVPDSSWVTRPPTEDETEESLLCGHSERLAIAFQLIQKPTPSRIQVTKNLRVCGDCHQTIKLIAKVRQCLIIVRDANRVHHFHSNGECSCQGHF